jgi:energy-coupling factor transporter ATP-binding protein EcfA2
MEELRDIHAQGNTIIMVTHNPSLTTYATRVINMLDGEIDPDIKTVDDSELPRPGSPERISVRILSKKRPVELEVDSKTKVVVSGEHVTIGDANSISDVKVKTPKKKLVRKAKKKTKAEKKES